MSALVERGAEGCAFRCTFIGAREPIPSRWFGAYGVALVRRGMLIRQRVDGAGRATAIDIAGPGAMLPLGDDDAGAAGYAVSDALVCLCPTRDVDATLDAVGATAREIVRMHAQTLARVERVAEARSRARTTARVGALLVALSDTLSPPRRLGVIPQGLQQRDLGALVALRHESVCRALVRLEKQGLISRSTEGIRLRDREQLAAL